MPSIKTKNIYFINIIHGYFKNLHSFSISENYHLHSFKVAHSLGYQCVAIVLGGAEIMKTDPNLYKYIKIIEYKNIFQYIFVLAKFSLFQRNVFYINSHEIISYLSIMLTKIFSLGLAKNIFMAHTQSKRQTEFKNKLQDFIFKFTDRIRLNNITEKNFLKERGISEKKLYILPLVVEGAVFQKNKEIKDRSDLLYFGQISNKKNLLTILKALKVLKDKKVDIKLNVIGNIADYDIHKDLKLLGLENLVIIHGFIEHKDLNDVLNNFLISVNSSKNEGQCLAVYETSLSGCILCLPNIMSFKDVFKEYALFHEMFDYQKLSENIIYILENKDEFIPKVNSCIEYIKEEFNKEIIESKMKELFVF